MDRSGDWLFYGVCFTLLLQNGLHIGTGPMIVLGLAVGWFVNRRKEKHNA